VRVSWYGNLLTITVQFMMFLPYLMTTAIILLLWICCQVSVCDLAYLCNTKTHTLPVLCCTIVALESITLLIACKNCDY